MNISMLGLGTIGSAWAKNLLDDPPGGAVLESDTEGFPELARLDPRGRRRSGR